MNRKPSPTARRLARRLALQAIYQWQLSEHPAVEIEQQFIATQPLGKADVPYFQQLLRQVTANISSLDAHFTPVLDRPINELNPIELAILRIATYELQHALEIPYRVVIDEALRLAKTFGAVEGFKYVNAVLDRVARQIRTVETAAPVRKGAVRPHTRP